jgi:hypothetical protein
MSKVVSIFSALGKGPQAKREEKLDDLHKIKTGSRISYLSNLLWIKHSLN